MTAVRSQRGTGSRSGAIAGIVFVVLFIAGFMTYGSTPNSNASTAKWARYWEDSGHRTSAVVAGYLIVLSALAFIWFLVSFRQRLVDARPDNRIQSTVALASGLVFAAILLIFIGIAVTIPGGHEFGDLKLPSGDLARLIDSIAIALLLFPGLLAAALFVGSASMAARGTGVIPGWLVTVGYVAAFLLLFGVLFFPILALLLWVLITSIVLLRRSGSAVAA